MHAGRERGRGIQRARAGRGHTMSTSGGGGYTMSTGGGSGYTISGTGQLQHLQDLHVVDVHELPPSLDGDVGLADAPVAKKTLAGV